MWPLIRDILCIAGVVVGMAVAFIGVLMAFGEGMQTLFPPRVITPAEEEILAQRRRERRGR